MIKHYLIYIGWNAINWGFEENEFNELWTLDSGKGRANRFFLIGFLDWRWVSEATHGFVPPGRRGHSAIFIEENKSIIVFGGI